MIGFERFLQLLTLASMLTLSMVGLAHSQEPPPRAPLRETVKLDATEQRFTGVLTLSQLGTLDQPVGTRRWSATKKRMIGRSNGIHPSIVGETMMLCTVSGNDRQLVLANLDSIVYKKVISPIKVKQTSSSPFRRVEISPDKKLVAINPTQYGVIHPDPMFSDYKHDFEQKFLGTNHIVYLYDMEGRRKSRFVGYYEPTWTPDGKLLMAGDGAIVKQGLYVADPSTDKVERIDNGLILGAVYDAVVRHDGKFIVFSYQGQIWSMDRAGTKLVPIVRDPDYDLIYPTYSPDGKSVAYLKRGSIKMVQGFFLVDLDDPNHEHFVDLRKVNADNTTDLFYPWGPLLWTKE